MASATEKEMRMQTPIPYNHLMRESSSETQDPGSDGDPDRFAAPISVGSKLKSLPRYKECLKNHAANIGGNITDGCCEFMPSGEEGTLEALKCAACSCHRNFHRKEVAAVASDFSRALVLNHHHHLPLPPPLPSPSPSINHHRTSISLHTHNWTSPATAQPTKMSFGTADSSSEELNFTSPPGIMTAPPGFTMSKKRFRTKFTPDQKERMLEFAEKVGWRIPREDDPEVQRFCGEVGVKRQVLKVWMHNNKGSGKRVSSQECNVDC